MERENDPYVMAVSKKDGQTRWKVPGLGTTSWSSPRLVPVEETLHLVLSGIGKLVGLDSKSGEIRWTIDDINGNSTPTPVPVGDGRFLIAATTGREGGGGDKAARSNGLIGIKRQDDGSYQADFLWRAKRATSSFGSPLAHNGLAYFVNRQGVIYCLDLESGEEKYAQRTADSVWATPFAAGEHLYFFGKKGTTTVIKAGQAFEEVAVNQFLERTGAHLLGHNTHRTLCVTGLGQHFQIEHASGVLHRVQQHLFGRHLHIVHQHNHIAGDQSRESGRRILLDFLDAKPDARHDRSADAQVIAHLL
jgi:hypothetical protein